MKKLMFMLLVSTLFFNGCSKDDGGSADDAVKITNEEQAKAAFAAIQSLWNSTLRSLITAEEKTFTNETLAIAGGSAIVNGEYSTTRSSSSSSSRNSSYIDVFITFQDFQTDQLKISGTIRFFDTSNSRTACSSSGCASSYHTSLAYKTQPSLENEDLIPCNLNFLYNGQQISDVILFDSGKSDNQHWSVKVTNGNNETFSFSI